MLRKSIITALLLLGGSIVAFSQTSFPAPLPDFDGGNRGFLGIMGEKISQEKAQKLGSDNPYGTYITSVIPNTAADKAGIRPFDYIYGIDDEVTSRTVNLSDLLGNYEPDDRIRVQLVRNGRQRTINVTLGTRDDADYTAEDSEDKPFFGVLSTSIRSGDIDGARIAVVDGSSAQELGLEDGDIITEFNTYRILDWLDLTIAINTVRAGESVSIRYVREGENRQAAGKMGSANDRPGYSSYTPEPTPAPSSKKAFLGVVSDRISFSKVRKLELENPYGYYVTEVVPGSAADKAGVQPFDYIYGLDQYRVGEQVNLGALLKKFEPGDEATLHVVRKGQSVSLPVTFTSKSDVPKDKKKKERNACEKPFLGIMQSYDEVPEDIFGVQVNIVENSTAMDLGLVDGDVITSINGYCMVDWDDITTVLSSMSPGDPIEVFYTHYGTNQTARGTIKSYSETKDCDDCDCGKKQQAGIDIDIDMEELEEDLEQLGDDLEELGEDLGDIIQIRRRGYDVASVDVDDYAVSVSKADNQEINQLNQQSGQDLPTAQNLSLASIRIAAYPEEQEFRLAFHLEDQDDTMVEIYNPEGRRIYQYAADDFSGTFEDAVNVGQNGSGDYYLHIQQGDRSTVRKITLTER
jgi:S1-C subfamily serine protease